MLTVIGCGNPNRTDDGVGNYIARNLQQRVPEHARDRIRVFDAGTAGMQVMFEARGSDELIIVDASSSGSDPGAVFRVPGEELEARYTPNYSLHDFRWDHALYAGRKLFAENFPRAVTVYLIEAATLELGFDLSAVVQDAADRVVEEISASMQNYDARSR